MGFSSFIFFFPKEVRVMTETWFDRLSGQFGLSHTGNWTDNFGTSLRNMVHESFGSPISTLSLFSGAGGLDIGFHDAGFEVRDMVEIEARFAATLSENAKPGARFNGSRVHAVDIREFNLDGKTDYEFIIGGPPCQTFSAAGRRAAGVKGTSDPRGVLFEDYVRLLRKAKPRGFLFENVYGIVGAEQGEPWRMIVSSFEEAGYTLAYRVLDTADYGVPQHRERLFIVGIRSDLSKSGLKFRFPRPTHGPDSPDRRPFNTAGKALSKLGPQETRGTSIQGRWSSLIGEIPPGLNYSFFTSEMGHPRPVFAWRSKFSDFMYKADPETPVRTVKAQGGAYTGPLSWENRHFTVEEFKRLQTFPDSYEISGTRSDQIHQIGNSVPPQVARILGLAVLDQVFGAELPFSIEYLEDNDVLGFRKRKRESTKRYSEKAAVAIANRPKTESVNLSVLCADLTGEYTLGENFELSANQDLLSIPFTLKASTSNDSIHIDSSSSRSTPQEAFKLALRRKSDASWPIGVDLITISGSPFDRNTFTGALKVLENSLRSNVGIEDLIQLNGYYQNSSTFDLEFESNSEGWLEAGFSNLVSGGLDGEILPLKYFAKVLGLSEAKTENFMHELRDLGFEIRNSNTNPQIPDGHYLVPYLFPTLNARSTQLRKSLR
jgi:DNA (cytosine-5)-methyltransferase 1